MIKKRISERLEETLARIAEPQGEGARACLTVYSNEARSAAEAADARSMLGISLGPLDGAIVTIKDLFNVAGEVTRAGSKLLACTGATATRDATVVRILRQAGAIIVAKTNMTEFAFSGLGANPHFGTPRNPVDRDRVPGGSTSGGAVAVADGMCEIAIGTDTGGSCRTPAAFCGIVGYKSSRNRIPTDGAFPLSPTLDSIGVMARTVSECAKAGAVLSRDYYTSNQPLHLSGLRIGVARGVTLPQSEKCVSDAFELGMRHILRSGARITDFGLQEIEAMFEVNGRYGGIVPSEAFALHRERLDKDGEAFDTNVRERIERARNMLAADYIQLMSRRAELVAAMDAQLAEFDVVVMPTCPIVAPLLSELDRSEDWSRLNASSLGYTAMWNFFDTCALSLPIPRSNSLPVGLMLIARNGNDNRLFRIAEAVESLFNRIAS